MLPLIYVAFILTSYPGPRAQHRKGLVTLGRFPIFAELVHYVDSYIPYWMHSNVEVAVGVGY